MLFNLTMALINIPDILLRKVDLANIGWLMWQ